MNQLQEIIARVFYVYALTPVLRAGPVTPTTIISLMPYNHACLYSQLVWQCDGKKVVNPISEDLSCNEDNILGEIYMQTLDTFHSWTLYSRAMTTSLSGNSSLPYSAKNRRCTQPLSPCGQRHTLTTSCPTRSDCRWYQEFYSVVLVFCAPQSKWLTHGSGA